MSENPFSRRHFIEFVLAAVLLVASLVTATILNSWMGFLLVAVTLLAMTAIAANIFGLQQLARLEKLRTELQTDQQRLARSLAGAASDLDMFRKMLAAEEINGLVSVHRAARLQEELPPGSTVCVINPTRSGECVEISPNRRYVDLVRDNVRKGVNYRYIFMHYDPQETQLVRELLHREITSRMDSEQSGQVDLFEHPAEWDQDDLSTIGNMLWEWITIAIYKNADTESVFVSLTFKGLDLDWGVKISQPEVLANHVNRVLVRMKRSGA